MGYSGRPLAKAYAKNSGIRQSRRNQSGQLGYSRQISRRCLQRLQDTSGTLFTATDAVGNAYSCETVSGELESWVLIRETVDLSYKIQVTNAVLGHRPCMPFDKREQGRFLNAKQFAQVLPNNPDHLMVFVVEGLGL